MLLDQLVHDDDFPECNRLCRCDGVSELSCVADVRGKYLEYETVNNITYATQQYINK